MQSLTSRQRARSPTCIEVKRRHGQLMKTGVIYCLVNTVNGKRYIGQTVHYRKRMRGYANGWGHGAIGDAIEHHGWHCFYVNILATVPVAQLNTAEQFWIRFANCYPPNGYNLCVGGRSKSGYVFTDEQRDSLSKALTGRSLSDTHCARLSEAATGRKLCPETRQKLSDAKKGHRQSVATKLKRKSTWLLKRGQTNILREL